MMAVANDEWNGELTQFLDRLPPRPCLVPPAPSFCSVCGSLNAAVARPCKFFALRHERERGQTFIELEPKRRSDTFEIEIDFEEEDEDELAGAPMFEFGRPVTTTAIKGRIMPVAALKIETPAAMPRMEKPVEVEVYEAEVVEVVEEPPAAPSVKPPAEEDIQKMAEAEAEARRLETELIEKQVRAEREREQRETEALEKQVREDRERELREKEALEKEALEESRAAEKAAKAPPPAKPAVDQVLSRDEEERLEREIEEELAKAGLTPTPAPKAPERAPERLLPPDQVIAPIYSQPILKIIPPESELPKAEKPLPPPPPGYDAMMPSPAEKAPTERQEPAAPKEEPPAAPSAPEPSVKPAEPEKPAVPEEKPAPPVPAPAPKEPAPAPGQRRTGGLYGIFRRAPKEQPKPDDGKNGVDDELAKRLKKSDK